MFFLFQDWLSLNPEHELADLLLNMHNDIRTKSRHKKSLSDNFNISHEQMESNHKKYYEMFANLKEPQEFFSKITASSKSRFVSNFNNENLYEEKKTGNDNKKMPFEKNTLSDYFSNSLAIKNYNISASNISSLNTSFTKQNYEEPNNKNSIYYNSKSLFSNETDNKNQKFPGNYLGTTPPGLTPQKSNKELSQKFHDDKFLKDENLEKNEIEKNIKAEINLSFENNQNYFNSLNDNRNYPAYMVKFIYFE